MARLHQFSILDSKIKKDETYIIIDNKEWQNEKIINFNFLINYLKDELSSNNINNNNIEFYKYPENEKVPPEQCEPIEPIKIAIDNNNNEIFFWINNAWKKCQLLDR